MELARAGPGSGLVERRGGDVMSDDDVLADWEPGDRITPEVVESWQTQKHKLLEEKIRRLRDELAEAEQELADVERHQETSFAMDEDESLDEVEDDEEE